MSSPRWVFGEGVFSGSGVAALGGTHGVAFSAGGDVQVLVSYLSRVDGEVVAWKTFAV